MKIDIAFIRTHIKLPILREHTQATLMEAWMEILTQWKLWFYTMTSSAITIKYHVLKWRKHRFVLYISVRSVDSRKKLWISDIIVYIIAGVSYWIRIKFAACRIIALLRVWHSRTYYHTFTPHQYLHHPRYKTASKMISF